MDNNMIYTVLLALLSSVFTLGVMFYIFNKNRESKYNIEKSRVELSMMRKSFENQLYSINERNSSTYEKWKELNHLYTEVELDTPKSGVKLNAFLKASGVTQRDLVEGDYVFVLTPFHPKYDEVYRSIKNVCESIGLRCIRGDEQEFKSDIFTHVIKNIVGAKLVIANLTGRNPNVLYELGISHAIDKSTILVSKMLEDLPTDVKSKRIVTYKNNNELENRLLAEVAKALAQKS
ncbi:hypothetical protein ACPHXT_003523 [Vibrio alginolyticus]|nr:hypothetical protein [Vibrio parahaemolyticus]HCE1970886.1 hypothetical protein [Vibrio parahaemolyticus]